ncbi:hypothetical protein EJ02DRAFT_367836 [Clathrospora elynae]|uniref:Uncharacterized protein n=1 Tax=Clathrospora elynae TaxID=706981 RepID=A0A6A5TAZ5_9PLEO|nr:hypothetical protein EJ02DRAFT_367836 [Clathrospora elynae]
MGRVQLHCPSNKKTVSGFVIGAYQSPEQVLQGVRLAVGTNYAALYTVDAKYIPDPHSLHEDQRVLVAATQSERMLPDAPQGYILYDGEEGEDVDTDVECFGQPWEDLTESERCAHITSINEKKPTTRNKMRITRTYQSVQADLKALDATPQSTPLTDYETSIEQRWGITLEHFLPGHMKPPKFKTGGKIWDEPALATLAIFGSFTHGQARLAQEVLEEAVAMRVDEDQGDDRDPVVRKQDVLNAITIVYERAGVLPAKLTKVKSEKAREKEKRKAAKEKKKAGGKNGVGGA